MTGKELLYIEDALDHEQHFRARCREVAAQVQAQDLKNFVMQMEQQHAKLFQNFYNLL